jgi:outer membrane protein W
MMKKTVRVVLALLAIVVLGSTPLCAENMMLGVKGGLSLANLAGGDVYNNSIKYGGTGGVFMRYALSDIFAVQPEVLFAMKGAKYEAEGLKSQGKINYIEIPLLVRATMPNESKMKPSVFLGPAISILLSNKITNGEEIDIKDATKSSDIGLVAGAGIEYMLEKGCVLVDARYEMGLSSIMKKSDGEQREVKNRVISIMVGYGMKF